MRGKGCIIHFLFVLLVLDQARGVHGSSYMHARHVSARAYLERSRVEKNNIK